ncbi:MAG: fatty-acid oxidation protein subunit alpha, partial [Dolichospermum sp.]|nr:fatty-acid oxidation protein subunit alpha [Dolichospermum sp.]
MTDYHAALGQFLNYRLALEISDPIQLVFSIYLAMPVVAYETFFKREFEQISLEPTFRTLTVTHQQKADLVV